LKNFINYTLVILSIIVSKSLFFSTYNDDIILIIYFCFSLFAIGLQKNIRIKKYFLTYAFISSAYLLLQPIALGNLSGLNIVFGYLLRLFSFVLVISFIGYMNFSKIYVNVLSVFCVINLIIYFDQILLFKLIKPVPGMLTTFDKNVLYENFIFFAKQKISLSYVNFNPASWIKNPGIFGEGGLYQYFINIALIINIFINKKNIFNFVNIIFLVSILTTFSTVGYLIMIIILTVATINNQNQTSRLLKFIIIFPIIILLLISGTVSNKFDFSSTGFFSTQRRVLDTFIDSKVITNNPIIGIGPGNINEWRKYSKIYNGGGSSSNGLTNYMAKVGLLGFILTLYPFIFFNLKKTGNKMILLCNGLTLVTQGIIFMPIFLLSMSLLNNKERISI